MEKRRLTGLIALIVLLVAIGGIIYYDNSRTPTEPTTAAAPAAGATDEDASLATATSPEDADAGTEVAAVAPDAAAVSEPAEAGASTADAPMEANDTAEQQTAAVAPDDVAPSPDAAAAIPAPTGAPSFDIVRVETTGETVIAGQSEPNAKVEILDGATVIATTEANDRGEWTIVLDVPLAPGTHDLAIRTTSEDASVVALSDQRVTVSVPEPGNEDLLVVLNAPNQPSQVIEMSPTTDMAAGEVPSADAGDAGDAPAPAQSTAAATGDEPAAGETAVAAADAAAPAQETENASPPAGTTAEAAASGETAPADAAAAAAEMAAGAPAADGTSTEAEGGAATGVDVATEAPAEPTPAAPAESEVAAAEAPAAPEPATEQETAAASPGEEPAPSAAATPTVDVAEAPADAGNKPADATAAADKPEATEPQVADADEVTEPPQAEADVATVTEPPAGDAPASAAGETETATAGDASAASGAAEAEVAAKPDASTADEEAAAEAEVAVAEPEVPPPPKPQVIVAAVEAETTGRLYIAGTAATGEPIRVYLDDELVGEVTPSPTGTWLIETTKDLPAGTYTVRVDQVGSGDTVIARSEVPFEREVEVAVLKPSATAESTAGATLTASMPPMETVIIKRGDNLWRIARGTWGKGIRWSTIYRANDDQIRDPDLIYPGQVFLMPKGDVAWPDEGATPVQN